MSRTIKPNRYGSHSNQRTGYKGFCKQYGNKSVRHFVKQRLHIDGEFIDDDYEMKLPEHASEHYDFWCYD